MDDLIAGSAGAYRALINPSFMDNNARQADTIKNQGMFFSPIDGDRKLPSVATRDIAAAAARLLLVLDFNVDLTVDRQVIELVIVLVGHGWLPEVVLIA